MLQQVQEEKQQLAIAIEALNKAVGALFSAEAKDISEIALQHPSVKAVWQQVQQREAGWQQLLQDLQIIAEGDISHLKLRRTANTMGGLQTQLQTATKETQRVIERMLQATDSAAECSVQQQEAVWSSRWSKCDMSSVL